MKNKYSDFKLNDREQISDEPFSKTTSDITMTSTFQNTVFKLQSPKMFHRKPSFKMYQRKEKKQSQGDTKICFISPEKSDIFKKYSIRRENDSDLDSSIHTNNSSQMSSNSHQNCKYKKFSFLPKQIHQSRSILNQINNVKSEDPFRTPKNGRTQPNATSPVYFRKVCVNKLKAENQSNLQNPQNDFDNDFSSLIQIKNFQSSACNKQGIFSAQNTKRLSMQVSKDEKQNFNKDYFEIKNNNSKIKTLEEEVKTYQNKVQRLERHKSQLEQSSKLFLEEVRQLRQELEKNKNQKQHCLKSISSLNSQISQKDKLIQILENQLKSFKNSISQHKIAQNEENQHYKTLYFDLNQKFKYLSVENGILKKIIQEKKQDQLKVQKLETTNKKLTAKNKYLTRQIEDLQRQINEKGKLCQNKKGNLGFKSPRNESTRNSMPNQFFSTFRQKKSVSVLVSQGNFNFFSQRIPQNQVQNLSIISNGSSLQLSFELSPDKKSLVSNNDQSQVLRLNTANNFN